MPPKAESTPGTSKNIRVILSKSSQLSGAPTDGAELTEIHAQISVPPDGGWGWMVVFTSFLCVFILDGVAYTFGSIITDIAEDLNQPNALIALLNSVAIALYFMSSPLVAALINRFGFRACIMAGSIICSNALLFTYFADSYPVICFFYGVCAGFGYSLVNLTSSLIVGFYFEKLRALAMAISSNGSSIGIMVMFPVNSYLSKIAGWRTTVLLHSGMLGLIYFLGMTYRPVLALTVLNTAEDTKKNVTVLPNLSKTSQKSKSSKGEAPQLQASPTEKMFQAVANIKYPTAADIFTDNATASTSQPTTSGITSRMTVSATGPVSQRQLQQVQSLISRTSGASIKVSEGLATQKPAKRRRIFHWEKHRPESRPLYRDDTFYTGKLENLPEYQKSVISSPSKSGLEYQLAVSRAMTVDDIREHRGICTTALRRILATMMDPTLLHRTSFRCLCASGFTIYMGYLIPYVFIKERNLSVGIDPFHCTFIVSVIGFTNAVGKLVLGILACKLDPVKLYVIMCVFSGLGSIMSNFSYGVIYQYVSLSIFGFFIASLACLRNLVICDLFGLDKLTNASGIMLLFQGLGSLISTPVASLLKDHFGFTAAFYFAGIFMIFSGLVLIPIKRLAKQEEALLK